MFRSALLALTLLCPSLAVAQSFTFDGRVALSAHDLDGGSSIGVIDVTGVVPLGRKAPLGFEFGAFAYALTGKHPHETYAALVWNDRWRAGVVRPAYDSVLPSVFARAAPYLAYERAEYARAHATVEAMRHTAVPWGLSWRQSLGRTDVAVSLHDASKGHFGALSLAVAYNGEGWQLAAAIEAVSSDRHSIERINAKIGARVDLGRAELGIAYLHPDANRRPDALALDLVVPVPGRLNLMAFGEFTADGRDDAYGIALDHAFRPDSSLLVAATDGARGRAFHLTLEHRF